ncbi:DUF3592 domain-containing protein [Permianibacter aggregans]|uniref:Uncharacterized protein DUF3592 n=1 Tax=Permianibacter aggregans TaxID=1510150 RepID=A0A4R6UBC7_9GAMM|nr:DUF3592 domain-containing protein [Permianibacter aggregans]QGX39681.1 DUF3592 domain-containing protein [Permianibacter aggregans]TDQ43212.1 uncharacterized protein DUF3592 [Permianibacter aggregans]
MKARASSSAGTTRNWGLLLPGLLFTAFSLYISYAIYWSHQQQSDASSNFVPVAAKILGSKINQTNTRVSGTTSSSRVYTLQVSYQYQVDDKTFTSQRFNYLGSGYDCEEAAQQVLAEYPVGAVHTAYYNPDNPADAVLIKSMPSTPGYIIVPTLFVLVGFLCVYAGWKGKLRFDRK